MDVGRAVGRLELVVPSSPPKPKKPPESSIVGSGVGVADLVRDGGGEEEEVSSSPKPKRPARPPPVSVGSALLDRRVVVDSLGAGGSLVAGGSSGSSISGLGEGGEDDSMVGSCRGWSSRAGMVGGRRGGRTKRER